MRNKVSAKTKLIIALIALIGIMYVLPIKEIIMDPTIWGAVVARVYITGTLTDHNCSGSYEKGWNLISIACIPTNTSVFNMFSSLENNYTSVHGYNTGDANDPWKTYNPSMPAWVVQDLEEISEENGYFINMNNKSAFYLNGTLLVPNTITYGKGWNLIGYPAQNSKGVVEALSTIQGSYSVIFGYNSINKTYYFYNASFADGTLEYVIPGYGYWINMTIEDELFVS
ncbi:MAG: hypothetical protein ABIC04_02560 [Nanoarchaeota archaeon]